jgi:Ca2+-binding RTX toxin-like protein
VVELNASGTIVQTYTEAGPNQSGSFAMAFNDDSVFVGDAGAGTVTQFSRTSGNILGTLTDGGAGSGLGASVIVNGDKVVIGSFTDVNVYDDDFSSANDPIGTASLPAGTFVDGVYNLSGTEILVADPFAATDENTFSAGKMYVYDLAELGGGGPSTPTVSGTTGNDTITVTQSGTTLTVTVNGVATTYENLPLLVINGGAGNDTIGVAGSVTTAIEAHGGDGNDLISGGGGADVLVGGAGSDVLVGQGGRDVLIGGDGSDILIGMSADDVLIAGATAHDDDSATLQQISATWNGAGTYSDRVAALKAGPLTPDVDIYEDGEIDILSGNGGSDWFVVNTDGSLLTRDLILDRASGEIRDDVDAFIPA